jgi:hypothetical protein
LEQAETLAGQKSAWSLFDQVNRQQFNHLNTKEVFRRVTQLAAAEYGNWLVWREDLVLWQPLAEVINLILLEGDIEQQSSIHTTTHHAHSARLSHPNSLLRRERRVNLRVPLKCFASLIAGEKMRVEVRDISQGGLCLQEPLILPSRPQFRIILNHRSEYVSVTAKALRGSVSSVYQHFQFTHVEEPKVLLGWLMG